MSSAARFSVRPSISTSARSPVSRSPAPSQSNAKGKQSTVQPETVVPIKKQKRAKKVVQHPKPDISQLGLDQEDLPPSNNAGQASDNAQVSTAVVVESSSSQWHGNTSDHSNDFLSRYNVADSDDFQNVWGEVQRK
jgi:hypothetical protein